MLVLGRSFSYTPHASFSEEFNSLTLLILVLMRSFPYTSHVIVASFSYTPDASFSEVIIVSYAPHC